MAGELDLEPERRLRGVTDGRCTRLDNDGCRCLRRVNFHNGPCDFPYTRWSDVRVRPELAQAAKP